MLYLFYLILFNAVNSIDYEKFNIRNHLENKCLKSGKDELEMETCNLNDSAQQFMLMKVRA